jgi:hypothetical protein
MRFWHHTCFPAMSLRREVFQHNARPHTARTTTTVDFLVKQNVMFSAPLAV